MKMPLLALPALVAALLALAAPAVPLPQPVTLPLRGRGGVALPLPQVPQVLPGKHLGPRPGLRRPGRFEHARTARWLLAQNSWGVVSTWSLHLRGIPFGNVASVSDLVAGQPLGTPYFLLTTLDPTAADAAANPSCSLTLSEAPLGTCGDSDPENPLCAKLTLSGVLEEVPPGSLEQQQALQGLEEKHAEMAHWPKDHDFRVYALRISDIFLIDFFGGARPVTLEEYYAVKPPLG